MTNCPACGAPLDADGVCTACGALSRGFFRGLELGSPQIATAVTRGLDFYRMLEVAPTADTHTIARRYRRLRSIFPEDPRKLAAEPSRKLELLELAGRVLTDPQLRQVYDQLRAAPEQHAQLEVLRCSACAAPFEQDETRCRYCGAVRPARPTAPQRVPGDRPLPADPIDYYAMLGITPEHLLPQTTRTQGDPRRTGGNVTQQHRPPTPEEIDGAAYDRQRALLMGTGLADVEREQRYRELEVARRLLREERRRIQYDAILQALWRGMVDQIRLGALQQIQESILAEMHEGQSEQLSAEQVAATLQQAEGYIVAGMPREALPLLRATIAAAPDQITAHGMFAHAILASDDPLSLGAPLLRQALASLEKAPASEDRDGRVALCRGLIAREEQRLADADTQLRHATRLSSQKSVAWRALAAIALARADYSAAIEHAQAAFAADHADERALLMIVAASMRAGRREQAREAAAQVAQLRGGRWNVQAVLDEMRS